MRSYLPKTSNSRNGLLPRVLFIFFALIIYRIGTYIPLPGINTIAMTKIAQDQSSGVLGMFDIFTGGALGRMSIFSLNIMPYITSSIIMQLMTVAFPSFASLKKDGELGRKKINQYTKYLTIIF